MGALYDKLKTNNSAAKPSVSTTKTGGSLYDRIKNKKSGSPESTTPFDTRMFVQSLHQKTPPPAVPRNESISSYSAIAPKNFGLPDAPKAQWGIALPSQKLKTTTAESTPTNTINNPVNVGKGILEGAKAVGNFGKEIVQGINRTVGTVGITAGNASTGLYNRIASKAGLHQFEQPFQSSIDTTGSPITRAVFGDTPVKDLPTYGQAGLDFVEKLTGQKIDAKYAVPFGVLGIITDLSGMGGPAKKAGREVLQKLAVETSEVVIEKEIKRLLPELADDVVKTVSKSIAAEKDYTKVASILDNAVKEVPNGVVTKTEGVASKLDESTPITKEKKIITKNISDTAETTSVPKTTLYHGSQKTVTPVTKSFERVISFKNDQQDVIKQFAEAGDVQAQKLVDTAINGRIDYRKADAFLQKRYANSFDAIRYENNQLPTKGVEYHDLKRNQFLSPNPELAKLYAMQNRTEAAVLASSDTLPKFPPLPKATIQALEKPQVDATINDAIMTRYRDSARKPVVEDTELAKAAKEPSKGDSAKKLAGELLTPIASRLGRINPELKTGLRKFEYEVASKTTHDSQEILPLLKATQKMTPEDQALFDLARKNGDSEVIDALAKRYDIEDELNRTRDVLDSIFERAKEVGMDINYRKDYFPRMIKNPQKFVAYLRNDPEWSTIRQLIEEAAKSKGIKYFDLTDEEMSAIVNNFIRGYGDKVTLSKPGFTKARTLEVLDDKLNEFYESSDSALSAYVIRMNDEIEGRKFFGKNLNAEVGDTNIQDSIGAYVMRLVAEGKIKPDQEKEVADIFKARFHRGKMNGTLDVYRNLEYISTMGSPISAITQIGDLAFSLYENGFWHTAKGLSKALSKEKLTKEALGIENITQEFTKDTMSGRALETIFKYTGLEKMDRLGKETLVNGYLSKLKSQAQNGDDVLKRELDQLFDTDEAKLALEELKNGEITERTKYLAFNKLLDFQPVAKSEMPQKYLEMPNGRIFYMLKSYSLKQIDVFRREAIDKIISGNKKEGFKNLMLLSGALVMANATADEIKDFILGRETPMSDKVVDNLWRLVGASKYDVYKARTDGVGQTILRKILFPSSLADRAYIDVQNLIEGKQYEKGPMKGEAYKLESTQDIPLAGKLYYWWFGRGAQKEEYKSGGKNELGSLPELPPLPKTQALPELPKIPSL